MPDQMSPEERFKAAASLQEPDRVPVCPWLTSAFYSEHYGVDHSQWYSDRELQLRAMVEFYTRFPDMQYFPGFRASGGSTIEASALGCEIVTLPGQSPHANPVVHDLRADVPKLEVPDPEKDGRMPIVLDHYRWLAEKLPEHGYEITAGFLHAPFDVALLVRGATDLLMELILDPEGTHALMEVVTETCIMWANAQYEACGGTMRHIMFSDDAGGQLSPKQWPEFSGRYIKRLVEGIPEGVITIAHNCDRVSHIIDMYPDTGIDALQLAPEMDIGEAKARIGDRVCLIGNLDPLQTLVSGTPEKVERECRELIAKAGPGGGFILSASGCLNEETPLENIEAMVRAADKYGRYPLGG
jgi:MtaA/CmuA family methyltransferase